MKHVTICVIRYTKIGILFTGNVAGRNLCSVCAHINRACSRVAVNISNKWIAALYTYRLINVGFHCVTNNKQDVLYTTGRISLYKNCIVIVCWCCCTRADWFSGLSRILTDFIAIHLLEFLFRICFITTAAEEVYKDFAIVYKTYYKCFLFLMKSSWSLVGNKRRVSDRCGCVCPIRPV